MREYRKLLAIWIKKIAAYNADIGFGSASIFGIYQIKEPKVKRHE